MQAVWLLDLLAKFPEFQESGRLVEGGWVERFYEWVQTERPSSAPDHWVDSASGLGQFLLRRPRRPRRVPLTRGHSKCLVRTAQIRTSRSSSRSGTGR